MREMRVRKTHGRHAVVRVVLVGLVTALAGALLPVGSASAVDTKPEWGSVSVESGPLKRSCRNYPYDYNITAPEPGLWDLNVRLVGPGGRVLWFGYLTEGANPAHGTATFRLCRSKTKPGLYKLRAVVSVQDGNDNAAGRLPTSRFRLRASR
jgi:hypothetical protein